MRALAPAAPVTERGAPALPAARDGPHEDGQHDNRAAVEGSRQPTARVELHDAHALVAALTGDEGVAAARRRQVDASHHVGQPVDSPLRRPIASAHGARYRAGRVDVLAVDHLVIKVADGDGQHVGHVVAAVERVAEKEPGRVRRGEHLQYADGHQTVITCNQIASRW